MTKTSLMNNLSVTQYNIYYDRRINNIIKWTSRVKNVTFDRDRSFEIGIK